MTSSSARRNFVLAALEQYECRLTRYATRLMAGDAEAAQDVVQHSFLKLCQQDPEEIASRVGPWLFRVCRNRVVDEQRHHTRGNRTDPVELDQINGCVGDPGSEIEATDFLKLIQQLIDGLPTNQREVAELWSQDFSNREIAEITGKSEPAVRVSLHRAIQQIRQHPSVGQWLQTKPQSTPVQS